MATVYLKGGKTVEVALEQLEEYLNVNSEQLETRNVQRRGQSRQQIEPSASSK